ELPENWTDTRETLLEGMLFSLKYMGMTLVEQPKGEELSAAAVKRIVATAKASGKKLQKVTLKVSPRGIVLNDSRTNELIENISIYRWVLGLSWLWAAPLCCSSPPCLVQRSSEGTQRLLEGLGGPQEPLGWLQLLSAQIWGCPAGIWCSPWTPLCQGSDSCRKVWLCPLLSPHCLSALPTAAAMGNLLDLEDPGRSPLESPELDNSSFGPSPSVNNNVVWEMDDGLDEAFSRLAQSRTNPQVLDTGLTAQDMQSAETLSPVDWNKMEPSPAEKDDLFMF
ncbi:ARH protein, partial [Prunella himalayana]|nr:ARH protein [Prunella himalayana]